MPKLSEFTRINTADLNTTIVPVIELDPITNNRNKNILISDLKTLLTNVASSQTLGTVKVGTTLTINGSGVLNVAVPIPDQSTSAGKYLSTTGLSLFWTEPEFQIPISSSSTLGGVIVDGTTISSDEEGVISAIFPTASISVKGMVKVDGSTITISNGTISATQYSLPTASTSVKGGVKVDGTSITISNSTISATPYSLPTASPTILGGVKVDGSTITISNGVISAVGGGGGGGGVGLSERINLTVTTSSIANNTTDFVEMGGYKSYALLKIQTDVAAWVRFYTDEESRTADYARDSLTDPAPGSGVIAEFMTTGNQQVIVTPAVFGFNAENTPTINIPMSVTNKSGSTTSVTVIATILRLET